MNPRIVLLVAFLCASWAEPRGDASRFFHLQQETDRTAFRRWFTFLAELQAYQTPPAEVTDCASLVRFAYREALRDHTSRWASDLALPLVPGWPSVRQYHYPYTPWKAALFQVDAEKWAEFADARTLRQYNAHFVSRDVARAQPGDLLFFRQLSQALPYHVMVFVGRSQVESGATPWLVYHTGPSHGQPGELRRVALADLRRHPSPQWRPDEGNSNFLGVYCWNILRRGEE